MLRPSRPTKTRTRRKTRKGRNPSRHRLNDLQDRLREVLQQVAVPRHRPDAAATLFRPLGRRAPLLLALGPPCSLNALPAASPQPQSHQPRDRKRTNCESSNLRTRYQSACFWSSYHAHFHCSRRTQARETQDHIGVAIQRRPLLFRAKTQTIPQPVRSRR